MKLKKAISSVLVWFLYQCGPANSPSQLSYVNPVDAIGFLIEPPKDLKLNFYGDLQNSFIQTIITDQIKGIANNYQQPANSSYYAVFKHGLKNRTNEAKDKQGKTRVYDVQLVELFTNLIDNWCSTTAVIKVTDRSDSTFSETYKGSAFGNPPVFSVSCIKTFPNLVSYYPTVIAALDAAGTHIRTNNEGSK